VGAAIDADLAAGLLDGVGQPTYRCGPEVWPEGTTTPRWGDLMGPPARLRSPGPA
jgi:hypothetical protein